MVKDPVTYVYVSTSMKGLVKPIDNHDAEDYHSQHHRSQKSALEWLKILAAPAAPCKIG